MRPLNNNNGAPINLTRARTDPHPSDRQRRRREIEDENGPKTGPRACLLRARFLSSVERASSFACCWSRKARAAAPCWGRLSGDHISLDRSSFIYSLTFLHSIQPRNPATGRALRSPGSDLDRSSDRIEQLARPHRLHRSILPVPRRCTRTPPTRPLTTKPTNAAD